MMRRFFLFCLIMLVVNHLSCHDKARYFIRQACLDDKRAMIDLYKKSESYYKDRFLSGRLAMNYMVGSYLMPSIDEGFAFVVELVSGFGEGKIIAFLIHRRPLSRSCRHILDQGLSAIDPDFKDEMLLTQLYKHLQVYIQSYFPDILRVEGLCHERAHECISMFERCDFVLEGVRQACICLSDGYLADELLFVWWNKNFYRN
jgi:hypothetical protein